MDMAADISIRLEGISKKFCSDIKTNLWYCLQDVTKVNLNLSLKRNRLRKKEFWALDEISTSISKGEVIAMVGKNGSGKTTLSRIISGIYQPDKGNCHIGSNLRVTPIFALKAGLHPLYTGKENIYLKAAAYGMNEKEIDEALDNIITFSELGEFIHTPVGSYSTGMKARLSYAIAMATNPDIFVIDEALAVGDAVFRAKCLEHIRKMTKERKKTVVYVTHHLDRVLQTADRVLVLDKGKLIRDTYDVKDGLQFYIKNCLKDEALERQEALRELIEQWDNEK